MSLSNSKRILITGASSGFGKLIAQILLEAGHTVFATMRNLEGKNAGRAAELTGFADKRDGNIHLIEIDVTDDESVKKGVRKALELEQWLDVVINNAGIGNAGFAEATTVDQFKAVFDVNINGVQRINRAVLPSMRERGNGLIIFISSIMGRIVLPFAAAYTASKFALEGLAESYRYELAPTGIDVSIVEPGGFLTGFFDNMQGASDTEREQSYGKLQQIPDEMWSGMAETLQSEEAPDPRVVAEAVLELIEMSPGKRPLRKVVDPLMGGEAPETVNSKSEEIQQQLLSSMDMNRLLSVNAD